MAAVAAPQYNIYYRHHNIPQERWFCIDTKTGTTEYVLDPVINNDDVKDAYIIGLLLRRKTLNSNAPKTGCGKCRLINEQAFLSGKITIKDETGLPIKNVPIERYGYDNHTHGPGEYAQVVLPYGFDPTESKISFPDGSLLEDDECIEIGFIYIGKDDCKKYNPCMPS